MSKKIILKELQSSIRFKQTCKEHFIGFIAQNRINKKGIL